MAAIWCCAIAAAVAPDSGLPEAGNGVVTVTVDMPGMVNADVIESGGGDVMVEAEGLFECNETELGSDNVNSSGDGSFKGDGEHPMVRIQLAHDMRAGYLELAALLNQTFHRALDSEFHQSRGLATQRGDLDATLGRIRNLVVWECCILATTRNTTWYWSCRSGSIAMSHTLRLKDMAEDIETQDQHDVLKEHDWDFHQGI